MSEQPSERRTSTDRTEDISFGSLSDVSSTDVRSLAGATTDLPSPLPVDSSSLTLGPDGQPSDSQVSESVRDAVPGYEILRELGRGGMGVVYLARDRSLNRLVALKMILSGEHAGQVERARFLREAQSVAALHHSGIVQIHEVGESSGRAYLAFEYVEGGSLAARLDGTPWPARSAAVLVESLARAMGFAHDKGIVHRDLKPGNILLSDPPGTDVGALHPKVTDFGLAKRFDPDSSWSDDPGMTQPGGPTRTGAVVGTPSYIAPEQAAGKNRIVGPPADIYSLGAVLYELLTGRPPFRGETPLDTVLQVMADDPVPPSKLRAKLPRDIEIVCLKCLHKSPAKRYESATQLADDLGRFLHREPIAARAAGPIERSIKFVRRHPVAAMMGLVCGLAVLAVLVVSLYFNFELQEAADREKKKGDEARIAAENAERSSREADDARKVADTQRQLAEKKTNDALKSESEVRRGLFALQLFQAAALSERDPQRAAAALDDPRRCPTDLRDFTWRYLRGQCGVTEKINGTHNSPISHVAYSPDGKYLIACGWEKEVRIWEVGRGRLVWRLVGHQTDMVLHASFSRDGRTVATAGEDLTVRLWQLPETPPKQDGVALKPWVTLTGHTKPVRTVVFDPETNMMASGSDDGTVRIIEIPPSSQPGKRLKPIDVGVVKTDGQAVLSAVWTPSGLYVGTQDGMVRRVEPEEGGRAEDIFRLAEPVVGLAGSEDGEMLAAVGNSPDEPFIQLWRAATGKDAGRLRGHTKAVYAVSFSADGKRLASGSRDGTTRIWDVSSLQEKAVLRAQMDMGGRIRRQDDLFMVRTVAYSPDGLNVATGGLDAALRVWGFQAKKEETVELKIRAPLETVAISADRRTVAGIDKNLTVYVWRLGPIDSPVAVRLVGQFRGLVRNARAIALNETGTMVAAADDESVHVWKVTDMPNLDAKPTTFPKMFATALAMKQSDFVAASDDGRLRWIDTQTGKVRFDLAQREGRPNLVQFSPDGRMLITAGSRAIQVWNAMDGSLIFSRLINHLMPITSIAFSAQDTSGRWSFASADDHGQIKIWDVERTVAPPDGTAVTPDRILSVNERTKMTGSSDPVRSMAFSKDGRCIVTAGNDRMVRCWDPDTGQDRASLGGHTDTVLATTFRSDGLLMTIGREGVIRQWRAAR